MVESSTRVGGAIIIIIGFLISLTGIGLLIGVPMMIIGAMMLIPELFVLLLIVGIAIVITLMAML